MILQIVGLAAIPMSVFAMQRKTPYVGDRVADLRLSLLKVCEKQIKSEMKAKTLNETDAATAVTNIRMLKKANDHGWASSAEYAALTQVLSLSAKSGSTSVRMELEDHFQEMHASATEWVSKAYKDVTGAVAKGLDAVKKRMVG